MNEDMQHNGPLDNRAITGTPAVESLTPVAYKGEAVITTAALAAAYQTDPKRIQNNYARNTERFVEGKHFFKVEGADLRALRTDPLYEGQFGIAMNARSAMLWTKRGSARHAKMLETDQAWEVFEKLEDAYFRAVEKKEATAVHPALPDFTNPAIAARAWAEQFEGREKAEARLSEAGPKIAFHDAVTSAVNAQTVEEVAKALGTGRNRMFAFLRDNGLFIPGTRRPYQRYVDSGHFRVIEKTRVDERGERHLYTQTLVTGKGFTYIERLFNQKAAA